MSAARCPKCGAQWGPGALVCPSCLRLVHAEELDSLAKEAAAAAERSDLAAEAERWRRALALLPASSKQSARIAERLAEIGPLVPAVEAAKPPGLGRMPKWLAALGGFGLLLWKAKALLLFIATKGKLLFAGFASWHTLLSMFIAFGVYWVAWGWAFAAGILLSMYVHEIGHVVALKHYGIRASAPMFIPGIGAYVRLDQHPETPLQDARVGLAGPWFGLAAALVAAGLWVATDHGLFGAVARVGAWINLFNLIPIWQLDGGRAFASLTRLERGLAAGAIAVAWFLSGEMLLLLLLLGAGARTAFGSAPPEGDRFGLAQYVALLAALTALAALDVPAR